MSITVFNTSKYVDELTEAGVPHKQAKAQAESMVLVLNEVQYNINSCEIRLKHEINACDTRLSAKIETLALTLTIRLFAALVSATIIILAAIKYLS